MSDPAPENVIPEEELRAGFKSGHKDMEEFIKNIDNEDYSKTLNIDELLAKHLILQQEIQTVWTRHSAYRGSFQTQAETVEVEEKISRWRAEFEAARKEIEKRRRGFELLAHWKTLAVMHKRGCKPPSGALSVENTMRLTAENSDSETGPLKGLTVSTASKPLDETTISFSGASGAED
jgi:hypothetical protein